MNETYTITFGDVAENHVGMEKLGIKSTHGYSLDDISRMKQYFEEKGKLCIIHKLDELLSDECNEAYLLVIRDGLSVFCDKDEFHEEQKRLEKDTKALMRGRVVNKHARYNLCFDDTSSIADYENGKGTVVSFDSVPLLNRVRTLLPGGSELVAEGNYYHDVDKCGIGWHGDAERTKVIAIRTGKSMSLCYQWYQQSKPVGTKLEVILEHGDMYMMSEYATGTNWKKRKIPTLRHSAGCKKYTSISK